MSQKRFDQQPLQLHQSTTQFTLPQGTHSYIYWANLVCSFVFTPVILILVIVYPFQARHFECADSLIFAARGPPGDRVSEGILEKDLLEAEI